MGIVVLPEAVDEFEDAAHYYDEQEAGLGQRYRDEVDRHIRWVAVHTDLPRIRLGGYGRVNFRVFPYYVAYVVHQESIWVLAIAHGHRKPECWIERRLNLSRQDARPNDEERDRPPIAERTSLAYSSLSVSSLGVSCLPRGEL